MIKKHILIVLVAFFLIGCGNTNNNENNENSNTNSNSSNNSNTNSNVIIPEGKNIVNFYLFYSDSCSHCHEEIEWLKSIEKDYPYLVIHYYEASKNRDLYDRVKADYEITSTGVPLTIISNDYYIGFNDTRARKFLRVIEEESERENCDVVAKVIAKEDTKYCRAKNEIY